MSSTELPSLRVRAGQRSSKTDTPLQCVGRRPAAFRSDQFSVRCFATFCAHVENGSPSPFTGKLHLQLLTRFGDSLALSALQVRSLARWSGPSHRKDAVMSVPWSAGCQRSRAAAGGVKRLAWASPSFPPSRSPFLPPSVPFSLLPPSLSPFHRVSCALAISSHALIPLPSPRSHSDPAWLSAAFPFFPATRLVKVRRRDLSRGEACHLAGSHFELLSDPEHAIKLSAACLVRAGASACARACPFPLLSFPSRPTRPGTLTPWCISAHLAPKRPARWTT